MRIEGYQVNQAKSDKVDSAKKNKADDLKSKQQNASSELSDVRKPEISQKAKHLAQAKRVADSAPDVRMDKVNELKERISKGEYRVSPEALADKMINEHLVTKEF